MDKKLTIVVPCRNVENKIQQLSETFKNQKNQDFKLIFVNDCSDDNTLSVLKSTFIWKDSEDLLITSTDRRRYPGGARNFGVKLATTDYIWFIDADDTLFDDEVTDRVLKSLEYCHWPDCMALWNRLVDDKLKPDGYKDAHYDLPNVSDLGSLPVAPWAKVFKRELYVEMPEGVLCEDTPWWFLQADKFETAAILKKPCVVYDRNNKSAITETVAWSGRNPTTLETLAMSNILIKEGLHDKWISDFLRNVALMYDIRNSFKHKYIYDAWKRRFEREYSNLMTCRYIH